MKKSIPLGQGWTLSLDKSEIYPDDPGQGAPAMVYGPFGKNASLACALNEGEVSDPREGHADIPSAVYRKLERVADEADAWLYS